MRLEDVPELMQHIQLRMGVKAAARTSILSKSWLHAWSTIPTLRLHVPNEEERKQSKLLYIERTLLRYLHDNTPIVKFDLQIKIENGESASLAEKWIRSVATKPCLNVLSLAFHLRKVSFDLPIEIFSGKTITKLRVSTKSWGMDDAVWMRTSHHPLVINCVSLHELHLSRVRISEQVLDHVLSSCRLLAKIELKYCSRDLKTIKVKSLPCLDKLDIVTGSRDLISLEINNVPNLRWFCCLIHARSGVLPRSYSISLGSNVTRLSLGGPGLVTKDASLDMILGFPLLENLTLDMTNWTLGSFHFKSASIKRLSLVSCPESLIEIQVDALKLLFFHFDGYTMPSTLSFPISNTLEKTKFRLRLVRSFGASFFLKMREALELSSTCYVHITTHSPLDTNVLDDLKTRLQFPPATNVHTLSFETFRDECLWENSLFFDAFFEICHPKHVFAKPDIMFKHNNHFCKLMLREVLEKKTTTSYWLHYLKHVEIKTRRRKKWETLSNTHTSLLDGSAPTHPTFKLEWC